MPPASPPEAGTVTYRCRHVTRYRYGHRVAESQIIARLTPRPHPRQRLLLARLGFEPAPSVREDREDGFGNPVTYAAIPGPNDVMTAVAELLLTVSPPPPLDPDATTPWESVRDAAGAIPEAAEMLFESRRVPVPDMADLARPSFPPGRPVALGMLDLMARIHRDFTFDPDATTVGTPVARVMRERRGVCQDFAHLMIAALRGIGLPARYVSGYLRTGGDGAALVGAAASHAWVQGWCGPEAGWLDLDPTNGKTADTDHVTLAWGRDYDDVCPLRGVILGGGEHTLEVEVRVEPTTTA